MNEFLAITKGVFEGIGNFFSLKVIPSFIVPLLGLLFGLGNPMVLKALFLLVVIDFITGIASAYVAKEPIRSRSAVRSAFKVAVYGMLIAAGHLTEAIVPGTTFIEEVVVSFLALTELISIIENIGKMGYAVPKKLLNQLQKLRDQK